MMQNVQTIIDYLNKKSWKTTDNITFKKVVDNNIGLMSKPKNIAIKKVYERIKKELSPNYISVCIDEINSNIVETDYVIAAIQNIRKLDFNCEQKFFYSFQPCIRTVSNNQEVEKGYIRSFVNVAIFSINSDIDDYFKIFEDWISLLSKLSVHASRITLRLKQKTTVYNGIGMKIAVDGISIGEINLYRQKEYNGSLDNKFIVDAGFGLERITWACNNFCDFCKLIQSPSDYFLFNDNSCCLINMIVLKIMSGIIPNSKKYGLELRKNIAELLEIMSPLVNLNSSIEFSYSYWIQFISSKYDVNEVKTILFEGIDRCKKNIILSSLYNTVNRNMIEKNLDDMSNKLMELKIERNSIK